MMASTDVKVDVRLADLPVMIDLLEALAEAAEYAATSPTWNVLTQAKQQRWTNAAEAARTMIAEFDEREP